MISFPYSFFTGEPVDMRRIGLSRDVVTPFDPRNVLPSMITCPTIPCAATAPAAAKIMNAFASELNILLLRIDLIP
jgi:hypothetical protein